MRLKGCQPPKKMIRDRLTGDLCLFVSGDVEGWVKTLHINGVGYSYDASYMGDKDRMISRKRTNEAKELYGKG